MPEPFDREAFSSRVRQARLEAYGDAGIPRLAEELGIPPMSWSNYEMGVTIPDRVMLEFLSLTGASPHWLATGEGQHLASGRMPGPPPSRDGRRGSMLPMKPLRLSTDLDVIPFASDKPPDDLGWLICVPCQLVLHHHQPDVQAPARLLGTCDGCGRWYLILMKPDGTSALMVALPEGGLFRTVWDEYGAPDGRDGVAAPSMAAGPDHGGIIEAHAP